MKNQGRGGRSGSGGNSNSNNSSNGTTSADAVITSATINTSSSTSTNTSGKFVGTVKQIFLVQVAAGACQDFGQRIDRRLRMPGPRSDYTAMGEEEGEGAGEGTGGSTTNTVANPPSAPSPSCASHSHSHSHGSVLYDSVKGGPHRPDLAGPGTNDSTMYVVYKNEQVYPQYLLTYCC